MSGRTDFAGLEVLAPGDLLSTDGYRFQAVNPVIIARLLRLGAVLHKHDEHAATPDPTEAPTLVNKATGGTIPAGLNLSVGFTWLDTEGGETLLSPVATVATEAEMGDPQFAPEVEADYTTGTLLASNFDYGLTVTDGLGGESALSPVASIQLLPKEHGAVLVKHLKVILEETAPGIAGAEWRLWRSQNGGPQYLMAQGKGASVLDDGSLAGDCTVSPPSTSTALGTNKLEVTVGEAAPERAEFLQVYISSDGSFSAPCLIAQYPLSEIGKVIALTSLVFAPGSPPPVTLSIPGASKIDPDTDMLDFPFKSAVTEPSTLPTEGNKDGDVREALSNHKLYIWDATDSEWNPIGEGGEGGGGEALGIENGVGTLMPAEPKVQFTGAGVTTTDDAAHNRTVVTIPGGGGEEEGGEKGMTWEGIWKAGNTYAARTAVQRNGSSYFTKTGSKGEDPAYPNLAPNGNAEEAGEEPTTINGATVERSTEQAHSGEHSFKVTPSEGSVNSGIEIPTIIGSGKPARAQGWVFGEAGDKYRIALMHTPTEADLSNEGTLVAGWNLISVAGTTTKTITAVRIDAGNHKTAKVFFVDDVGTFQDKWELLAAAGGDAVSGGVGGGSGLAGTTDTIVWAPGTVVVGALAGYPVFIGPGESTKRIIAFLFRTGGGTATITVRKNGVAIPALTNLEVTEAPGEIPFALSKKAEEEESPVPVTLSTGDFIDITVTATSEGVNMSAALVIEKS